MGFRNQISSKTVHPIIKEQVKHTAPKVSILVCNFDLRPLSINRPRKEY